MRTTQYICDKCGEIIKDCDNPTIGVIVGSEFTGNDYESQYGYIDLCYTCCRKVIANQLFSDKIKAHNKNIFSAMKLKNNPIIRS